VTKTQFLFELEDDNALLTDSPELSVWMAAFGCLQCINELKSARHSNIVCEDEYFRTVNGWLANLMETAHATHRFDVVLPVTADASYPRYLKENIRLFLPVQFYSTFWRWYNWWSDYMHDLPEADRKELHRLYQDHLPEIKDYRPKGDWLRYRPDPALILTCN
jgi:hypothetical protein